MDARSHAIPLRRLDSSSESGSGSSSLQDFQSALNLQTVAYENQHSPVFHAWRNLAPEARLEVLKDRYVFYSVSNALGGQLSSLLKVDIERSNALVEEAMSAVSWLIQQKVGFTEEWFKGLECLAGTFIDHHYVPEARVLIDTGLRTGVSKFPRISQAMAVHAAYIDALNGMRDKAAAVALHLVRCPYLLPSRRELPALCQRLMFILAAGGCMREYRLVLWTGVTSINANPSQHYAFADQITKTYRGTFRAIINSDVAFKFRVPFFLVKFAHALTKTPLLRYLRLDVPVRHLYLANLYILDRLFFRKNELFREANAADTSAWPGVSGPGNARGGRGVAGLLPAFNRMLRLKKNRRILITRAMGGIGDILMMTPGVVALRRKYPNAEIDFAVPRSFHPVLAGLPGVKVLDIDADPIELRRYTRWINLTDCPAGRVESRQYPNVRTNRIEAFAGAMGVSKWRLRFGRNTSPIISLTVDEKNWGEAFVRDLNPDKLPVVGLQPVSADSYKNWPYMEELALRLSKKCLVIVFHHEVLVGFDGPNIIQALLPIRKSIALLSMCDRLVAVDSSFVHAAAALSVKTLAIFGPTSGKVFSRYYPSVRYLSPQKREYPCAPCWRNEHKPCHLTGGRESVCLKSVDVSSVESILWRGGRWKERHGLLANFISWVKYGVQ